MEGGNSWLTKDTVLGLRSDTDNTTVIDVVLGTVRIAIVLRIIVVLHEISACIGYLTGRSAFTFQMHYVAVGVRVGKDIGVHG